MKLGNGTNEVDVTNARNYRTSLSQIVKDVHTFSKKMDVEYTLWLEEYEHAIARAKQEVDFLEASLAKQKANIIEDMESFKSSFLEVSHIRKELNDASISEYKKNTDSIRLKRTVNMWQL